MAELWFYHLERSRVEDTLPDLLGKVMARGGRALVTSADDTRLSSLESHLWTYSDDSFLPHGMADGAHAEHQPVLLSETGENLNAATMLFCLDGADPGDISAYERAIVMFEASDETALARARALWAAHRNSDIVLSYWKQNGAGRWEKQG